MQIHELPQHSGTPANESDFAIDTGTSTFKIPFVSLAEAIITAATATINGVAQTVKAAIEALTERVTTAEGNIADLTPRVGTLEEKTAYSQTTATLGGKSVTLRKYGRVVTFEIPGSLTPNPAITAGAETIYRNVIPAGYRPAGGFIFIVMSSVSATGAGVVQMTITTAGDVAFYNWTPSAVGPTSGWIRGVYTYVCAE